MLREIFLREATDAVAVGNFAWVRLKSPGAMRKGASGTWEQDPETEKITVGERTASGWLICGDEQEVEDLEVVQVIGPPPNGSQP